nr:phosphatidylinositol N-acetylglucosaminyltransferase subunit Y-like [Oryctolagus cuniculus]
MFLSLLMLIVLIPLISPAGLRGRKCPTGYPSTTSLCFYSLFLPCPITGYVFLHL